MKRKMVALLLTAAMTCSLLTALPINARADDLYSGWLWPVESSIHMSRGFAYGHLGQDILPPDGCGGGADNVPVVAAKAGTVVCVLSGCSIWNGYWGDHYSSCNPSAAVLKNGAVTYHNGIRYPQQDRDDSGNVYENAVCNYGAGNGVVIDHGGGIFSYYCHMNNSIQVRAGDWVRQGQLIGYMGSYGFSTGKHLHFEIKQNAYMSDDLPGWARGDSVNNNPIGSEYIVNTSWDSSWDRISYSRDYSGQSSDPVSTPVSKDTTGYATIPDGVYSLSPACAPGSRLDIWNGSTEVGAITHIWQQADVESQKFTITNVGGAYYKISPKHSGLVLDVYGAFTQSGTKVYQYTWADVENQKWVFFSAGNGYYYIRPSHNTNLGLDVSGGYSDNGTNVLVYEKNTTNAQKWKLEMLESFDVSVTSVSLDQTSLAMKTDDAVKLSATVYPATATNRSVTWTSSNPSVAAVTSGGVVRAVGAGTATITVTTNSGGKQARCYVTVTPKVYTISFDANGGTNAPAAQTTTKEETITRSEAVPTREGYMFLGWAISADATKASFQPGGTYDINKTLTLYAVWKPYEYKLAPLVVRTESGDPLTAIPSGSFLVTVPITKQTAGGDAMILLAAYTKTGQYRGLMYVAIKNATVGATVEVTLPVKNETGDIATLKAFAIPSFGNMTPLGPASVFPTGESQ